MKPHWHEMIALFGGSFDPPHLGHLEAARGLFSFPGLKSVRVLPSPLPPHKSTSATIEQRLEMVRLNFNSLRRDNVSIDTQEIQRSIQNPHQHSFTYDTLIQLRRELPSIAFVLGADQLEQWPTWHRFPEILNLCHWIVLLRKPTGALKAGEILRHYAASGLVAPIDDALWKTNGNQFIQLVHTNATDLSSTQIREAIAKTGKPPVGALHPEVERYLKLHRIYGMG